MCKSDPSSPAEHCSPQESSAELAQGAMGRVPGEPSDVGGVMGTTMGQGNLAPAQGVQAIAAHVALLAFITTYCFLFARSRSSATHQQELEVKRMISNRLICQMKPSELWHFGLAIQRGPQSRAQLGSFKGSHTRLTATGSSQGTHLAASETHGHTNRLSKATLQV